MAGGDPIQASQADFSAQVRDALANLYDPVALRAHPLGRLLASADAPERGSQGSALRQKLTAAIEDLKPGPEVDPNARPWRPYRILRLRYIEWLEPTEVQHRLAISRSLYYREHESALAALVAMLWEKGQAAGEPGKAGGNGSLPSAAGRPEGDEADMGGHKILPYGAASTSPQAGARWRWRVGGASVLGLLVALSVLLFSNRAAQRDASARARAATNPAVAGGPSTGAAGQQYRR